jgi:aspartate/methionine/tyrosine aminotransferase
MYWALEGLPVSGIREVMNRALERPGVLRLETGEPDGATADHILAAFVEASHAGRNRYTTTEGIPALREALARKIQRVNGVARQAEEILVTPGGIAALWLAFRGLVHPGGADEILVPDPGWPDYLGGLAALNAVIVRYPLQAPGYVPRARDIEPLITPRTRGVVLNCPGNPGGAVLGAEELQEVVDMARRHDVWLLSDEVYDEIVFEGPFRSPAELAPERTIQVMSFAKTYAMTGWRLGYLAAPEDRISSLTALAMGVWSSVAEPLQYAGIAALEGPDDAVRAARARYRARRDRVSSRCEAVGVGTSHPSGAFYLLVDVSAVDADSRRFAFQLLERDGVAVAPGSAFGAVASGSVRISLAAPDDVLDAGIDRLLHRLATGF